MSRDVQGPAGPVGPVLTGILGAAPAESALRYAFAEADHRGAELIVTLTGEVPPEDRAHQLDVVRRWADKYPGVRCTTAVRRRIDPAVVLVAASRACALLVVEQATDPAGAALVDAVSRRAHCPVVVTGEGHDH
ncbi:hypothetical protein GCM10020358_29580 [Amorphoplanes nipponensis]|uniref:Universal stress protein family protein n=1 Tax=Actinoplanes nipponensis TaxID=135950 RepID=A0A919JRK5_9ACTN|nr:hypothetical protein [Actinoplanes nipponensis]GIE54162.1 hypothetical protein Ani05nite_76960 [Actinoplanes nipponensis]